MNLLICRLIFYFLILQVRLCTLCCTKKLGSIRVDECPRIGAMVLWAIDGTTLTTFSFAANCRLTNHVRLRIHSTDGRLNDMLHT